jgi:hypothetical protein
MLFTGAPVPFPATVTVVVGELVGPPLPPALIAVSCTMISWLMSVVVSVYVMPVAPAMAVQLAPLAQQSNH